MQLLGLDALLDGRHEVDRQKPFVQRSLGALKHGAHSHRELPGVYLGLSLGVAFPLNLILGLPLYALAAGAL